MRTCRSALCASYDSLQDAVLRCNCRKSLISAGFSAAENLCDIVHANAKEMVGTRYEVEQIVQNPNTYVTNQHKKHGNGACH